MSEVDDALRRLRSVDLNLFVVFATVMRERNVTRASEQLLMSQAAVSAALVRLRKMFNDPLFTRVQGGVEPTVMARRLEDPIQRTLAELHVTVAGKSGFNPSSGTAIFKLGMSDDLEAYLLPHLIAAVAEASPNSALRCILANRTSIVDMIDDGRVDLGIVASDRWGPDYRSRVLFESRYALVYDPAALGKRGSLSKEEFLSGPHVMISADGTRGIVDDVLEAEGLCRWRLVSTAHFAMVPLLISRTASLAIMPRHVAEVFAGTFNLEVCEPPIDLPRFTVSVLWHRTTETDPALMWMIKLTRDVALSLSR